MKKTPLLLACRDRCFITDKGDSKNNNRIRKAGWNPLTLFAHQPPDHPFGPPPWGSPAPVRLRPAAARAEAGRTKSDASPAALADLAEPALGGPDRAARRSRMSQTEGANRNPHSISIFNVPTCGQRYTGERAVASIMRMKMRARDYFFAACLHYFLHSLPSTHLAG